MRGTKRKIEYEDPDSERAKKGLKLFSASVRDKVQEKKVTTYEEVANDLVGKCARGEAEKV